MKTKQNPDLTIGDLVKKKLPPGEGRLAIITNFSMENYYNFDSWVRVAYADDVGGYEWVHRNGIEKLNKPE